VVLFLVLFGGPVFFLLRAMASEMVKQEYTAWAAALARRLVRVAGVIHPARADEWWAMFDIYRPLHQCELRRR
jgi:hypothetical protein